MTQTLGELVKELLEAGLLVQMSITISFAEVPSIEPDKHIARCSVCGWSSTYTKSASARRGLRTHKRHCKGIKDQFPWIAEQNG